jgi:hypothetical protein
VVAQHRIAEFWRWFQAVSGQFGERLENRNLIAELDARIATLGSFSWELGPGQRDDRNNALVLTPSGDPDLLAETRAVIGAAPDCPGWEFYPAKPPKKWQRKFILRSDDGGVFSVDASGTRYVLFEYPDNTFDVLLEDQNLAALPEELQQTGAEVLLDGELGEERRIALIHNVEVVAQLADDVERKRSPIASLAAHLQSLAR